jgi:hypothetical protein
MTEPRPVQPRNAQLWLLLALLSLALAAVSWLVVLLLAQQVL